MSKLSVRSSTKYRSEHGPLTNEEMAYAYKTTVDLQNGLISSCTGFVLLMMSFCSPYWLAAWHDTQSPFVNMGLWEFCFFRFRHPDYQFDKMFHGCHALYGDEYRLIREKLLPGWLMVVQFFVTIAFMVSFVGLLFAVGLYLRCPLTVVLRFEHHFCAVAAVSEALSAVLVFLGIVIFGSCCWDRDWLLYPNYNYVSWSYALAVFACIGLVASVIFMIKDWRSSLDRKERNKSLLARLQPDLFSTMHHLSGSHMAGSGYL